MMRMSWGWLWRALLTLRYRDSFVFLDSVLRYGLIYGAKRCAHSY
jgi:hypothetical protein